MKSIPISKPVLGKEEEDKILEAVKSTWISSKGPFLDSFSKSFSEFCGTKYASTVCNGTAALHLALLALGIKPGDEVIVPDFTFAATANAVIYCGARPVLADVNLETGCMEMENLLPHVSKKTKAIIPVHLYGHPCKMDEIMEFANSKGIWVVEDAAESHGAEVLGKRVGSFGHIGCFSFYGNKIITTGEGGMCTTNDAGLFDKMELFKNHGMT
ncbi:MAG: DegT/DnrJ/EryC1/StrS aminotransferase family protein, partial [Candidatus Micrarchaeia archaeon]